MLYKEGDTVVHKDGRPGEWVAARITPGGFVKFRGVSGQFPAVSYTKKEESNATSK